MFSRLKQNSYVIATARHNRQSHPDGINSQIDSPEEEDPYTITEAGVVDMETGWLVPNTQTLANAVCTYTGVTAVLTDWA